MVDPFDVTDFTRTRGELEEYWLFCLAVAGKKATVIAEKIDAFLSGALPGETPFGYVRRLDRESRLEAALREARTGKYALLTKAYRHSASGEGPDLHTCTAADLERVPGAGPKTARFFLLHSRRGARVAVIDTHVLKYLASLGHRVPKGVPDGTQYARLEEIMLHETEASGLAPAEFDLAIWSHYASGGKSPLPERQETRAAA